MATALLPLERRMISITTNGVQKEAPSLHKMWYTSRSWAKYAPPPASIALQVPGAKDAWIYQASTLSLPKFCSFLSGPKLLLIQQSFFDDWPGEGDFLLKLQDNR